MFDVSGADVSYDGGLGGGDGGEGSDFAVMVHAHFDDSGGMFRIDGEESQGDADVVIEIAFGGGGGELA